MLSIIIPALNEEENLKRLLDSIENQGLSSYEIIVADAGSEDKTKIIAKSYGSKIVEGGLPAKGRNEGAKIAKGQLLLFLDADVYFEGEILPKVLKEFEKKKLKIATFCLTPSGSTSKKKQKISKFFFTFFYNIPILLMEKILPHAAMGILIEKKLFKKLKGFNEDITLAEDHDLARRAGKLGKYGILKSGKLNVSDRRFQNEGWVKTYTKFILCEGHMIFIGPVKKDLFKYGFDHLEKK